MRVRKLVWLVWMMSLVCSGSMTAIAADDGHERTDKLIERIDETVEEMREGQKHMEKTLAAYHDVFSREEKGRRTAYKELVKGLEKQEERDKKLHERFKQLEKEADQYFKQWSKSLKDINKGKLRDQSAARLDETKSRYKELIRAGEDAQKSFRPIVEDLHDQVVYLGHDLNQAAVESLETDQATITDLARGLRSRIDDYSAAAQAYVSTLNP
jgi:DNA repair exonuclease SbcCD ATPase subunit